MAGCEPRWEDSSAFGDLFLAPSLSGAKTVDGRLAPVIDALTKACFMTIVMCTRFGDRARRNSEVVA